MRRGEVYELLRRVVALRDQYRGYEIEIVDRLDSSTGVRRLPVELVERVTRGYMILSDGTMIPLHRVVGLVDAQGRRVWSRFS